MKKIRFLYNLLILPVNFVLTGFFLIFVQSAYSTEVAFAGFAYSGDSNTITARFPHSKKYEESLGASGLNSLLQKTLASAQPKNIKITSKIYDLLGRDQAVAVALVMTNEVVTTELIGQTYKLFVQLRGQAVFFDFKSKTVLKTYPLSFAYLDALPAQPTNSQIIDSIQNVYLGKNGKLGIIERFKNSLINAKVPDAVTRYVQVVNVVISDDARPKFSDAYGKGVAETWVADSFSEAIANKMEMPILPFSKGYALGNVMAMTISNGEVYTLTLPKPDYEFRIKITNLRKVVFEETAAGKSLIYGTYATFSLEEPLSGTSYLNGDYKNGEVKVVSALQTNTEDFPAFQDSMRGLFTKLAGEISGENTSWLKSATTGKDILKQMALTRELLNSCK